MACDKTPFKVANPGNPCCDICKIDSFTTDVEVTAANTAVIRSAQHPQSPYPSWLQVEMKVENGAIGKIFFLWDDATPEGIYIEFIPDDPDSSSGYVSVYTADDTRIAGPWYIDGAVSDTWHTFTLCYDPDTNPEEFVISFASSGQPDQSFNILLPAGSSVGRTAGYGTGNGSGSVWFQNYSFQRTWYCGDKTEDCHELGDAWDYYYDLPTRTVCHTCTRCPAGPTIGNLAHWNLLSGTWGADAFYQYTASANSRAISLAGQNDWQMGSVAVYCDIGNQTIVGISDAIGYNQVYLRVEEDAACNVTLEIFRVTNGGAPVCIVGPTVYPPVPGCTATYGNPTVAFFYDETYDRFYWYLPGGLGGVAIDGYVTLHAHMRNFLLGCDANAGTIGTKFRVIGTGYGYFNLCNCSGSVPPSPRKYTATVAGVAVGGIACTSFGSDSYLNPNLYNRSGLTLRNYLFYLDIYDMNQTIPTNHCCHGNWDSYNVYPNLYIVQTWITAVAAVGGGCTLHGYAWAVEITQPWYCLSPAGAEIHFTKVLPFPVDLRALSSVVLDFADVRYFNCAANSLSCTGATMTVTSVP